MTPREEIALWARETQILSEDAFRWARGDVQHDPRRVHLPQSPGYPLLVTELAQVLYERVYTRAPEGLRVIEDRLLEREFTARLAQANATRVSWANGYRLVASLGDRVKVEPLARPGAMALPASDFEPLDGPDAGRIRLPKGSTTQQPGWYHVRGAEELHGDGRERARLYWSLSRAGAAALVGAVTTHLNADGVPFHFKIVSDPQRFARADAAVLYLHREDVARAAPAIARAHAAVAPYLRAAIPAFTKPLARGLSAADDPLDGEGRDARGRSFGSERTRLVAEGLWDAYAAGASDPESRLAAVATRFEREGLTIERPWLNPGRDDVYDLRMPDAPLPALGGALA